MFINLVNTEIPFQEYQLTQEKIDALRFRLLLSESYLSANELTDDESDPTIHQIFLLRHEDQLLFLIVHVDCYCDREVPFYPLMINIVEIIGDNLRHLSDEEVLSFLSDTYDQQPDRPLTRDLYLPDGEDARCRLIEDWRCDLANYIRFRHRDVQPQKSDKALHHYECDLSGERDGAWGLSPIELEETEHLMAVVLKKIYNYDYQPE